MVANTGSNTFEDGCRHSGIKRKYTVTYTPQQNRVTERKNRAIEEAA